MNERYYLKSMTAYGRGSSTHPLGVVSVEVHSINRKHLDVQVHCPKELLYLEPLVRKRIAEGCARGHVTVWVCFQSHPEIAPQIYPNVPLALSLKKGWDALTEQLEMQTPFPLETFAAQYGLLVTEEPKWAHASMEESLSAATVQALEEAERMKMAEGRALAGDLMSRIETLRMQLAHVAELAPQQVTAMRRKLEAKFAEVSTASCDMQERLLREVVLYAEKVDVCEEVVRAQSHVEQLHVCITQPFTHPPSGAGKGKQLEFLLQELYREMNTMGSKSLDVQLIQHILGMKSEVEKMREQIQNIE